MRRQNTEAAIVEALHRDIERGEIAPGTPLLQEELAQRFGVSRVPIRDALKALEADGVIILQSNRTALVTPLGKADIEEIFAIRGMLETDLVRRATSLAADGDRAAVTDICAMLDAVKTGERFSSLDNELHAALYAPARRPRQAKYVAQLGRQVARFYGPMLDLRTYHAECQSGHRAIVRAYLARNAERAAAALARHLKDAERKIVEYLKAAS